MLKVKFELNINGVIEVIVYHGKGGPATQGSGSAGKGA